MQTSFFLLQTISPSRRHVYMGCIENRAGFMPIRSPQSKWYLSKEELPDEDVPWNVKYLAGESRIYTFAESVRVSEVEFLLIGATATARRTPE